MQSKPGKEKWLDISTLPGEEGREDEQAGWHSFIVEYFCHCSILDVGAGLGKSRERLSRRHNIITLQDVAPGLPVDITDSVEVIPDKSHDLVTAFDVIEHVVEDVDFLEHLCRIAKDAVFVTTPNYRISHAHNRRHVREYLPEELYKLARRMSHNVRYFHGSEHGWDATERMPGESLEHDYPHHAVLLEL